MSVSIEVSRTDEVRLRGRFKNFCRRKKWRIGKFAARFAFFSLVGVGIDRIDVAAMQGDKGSRRDACVPGISANQIRHAVLIEVSGRKSQRLGLREELSPIGFDKLKFVGHCRVRSYQVVTVS